MKPDNQDNLSEEDEAFIADTKAAMLSKSTLFAHGILWTLGLLILAGIIWAYFGVVEKIAIGEGKVIPSSQVKIIQSLDGGIVTDISVREGQTVKKNQILMQLDDTRYKADYQERLAKYLVLLAITSRLKAEAYNEPKIDFPPILNKHPEITTRETKFFETRRDTLKEEVALLQHSHSLAIERVKMYEPLVARGTVSKVDMLLAQRTANDIKSSILEKKNKFSKEAWEEFNKQNGELSIVSEELKSLHDKMIRTTITSPVNGIVKKLNVVTIGGVITPGLNIMEIVPMEDTLLVQVKIKPRDIAFIHVGQPANVRITAYDYTIYGSLEGVVEYISADAIEETKQTEIGEKIFYEVNIRTNRNYLGNEKRKLPIIPGMTASANIETGSERIMDYILKPLLKAKSEALRER